MEVDLAGEFLASGKKTPNVFILFKKKRKKKEK